METVKVFRSYRDAARMLAQGDPESAYSFLMAILDYGLDGTEPELQGPAAAAWLLVKPTLDVSIKKAEAGAKGGRSGSAPSPTAAAPSEGGPGESSATSSALRAPSPPRGRLSTAEAECKQTASKPEPEEGRRKKEVGSRQKDISPKPPAGFDLFWQAYPKKVGKEAARKAFDRVKVPVETLLAAIERQKGGRQWQEDGGRFIPNPATWLNQGRWEDETFHPETVQERHQREMDADEIAAIRRMMAEEEEKET